MKGLGKYMTVRTRFNPTINGKLHLGHAFTLLVNEYYAHSRNGEFFIRFDDDNLAPNHLSDDDLKNTIKSQVEDILWLDIRIDGAWIWQSVLHHDIDAILKNVGYETIPEVKPDDHKIPLFVRMGTTYIAYPYVVQQTVERVVMDNMLEITHVIRGDDFATEYSLYCYFCQKFGFHTPEFIYLPRLTSIFGDISKTNGGFKIADFRENGYSPDQLKKMLAKACLIYPNNGWEIYNIKSNPKINL